MNTSLERGTPEANWNNGKMDQKTDPSLPDMRPLLPLDTKHYLTSPIYSITPFLNGSVLDALVWAHPNAGIQNWLSRTVHPIQNIVGKTGHDLSWNTHFPTSPMSPWNPYTTDLTGKPAPQNRWNNAAPFVWWWMPVHLPLRWKSWDLIRGLIAEWCQEIDFPIPYPVATDGLGEVGHSYRLLSSQISVPPYPTSPP